VFLTATFHLDDCVFSLNVALFQKKEKNVVNRFMVVGGLSLNRDVRSTSQLPYDGLPDDDAS
jgi:hypothetical protein